MRKLIITDGKNMMKLEESKCIPLELLFNKSEYGKEWEFIGCGLDLNYSDNSSGENVCKDKYPGLCETNIEKCNSENKAVREAIMLDCPETCKVQLNDLDEFA